MVSRFRGLLVSVLILGMMSMSLPAVSVAAPVLVAADGAQAAPDKGSDIRPASQAGDITGVVMQMQANVRNLSFRASFIRSVTEQAGWRAGLDVNNNWYGTVDRLVTLTGRSPLTWQVIDDGLYRYYRNDVRLSAPRSMNARMGVGQAMRLMSGSDYNPQSIPKEAK